MSWSSISLYWASMAAIAGVFRHRIQDIGLGQRGHHAAFVDKGTVIVIEWAALGFHRRQGLGADSTAGAAVVPDPRHEGASAANHRQ
ncbi:hypothetical protein DIJ64_01490 [Mycobacterium leprae]|uniref:Uncharacterized protein n=2 Tax=Mycobacterium leprae TaxID=1769 RepID=A0AAD0P667_MYCLR|nr:hypothetical protein [Mycobacterium leprae]AWV47242.1 hypothetical protein DIJ64_01490 [Mycobacterium leprae]OAR20122.1 hypothetical protein A8144_12130 [Mycobacterium leprae 3125609]OAX70530.1 hypothetical protein A3216_11370 [Mycobacterium leprae 7935681]